MKDRKTIDSSGYKLGKKPARHDPRTLQLATYLELPAIPTACDWTKKAKAPWGMMKNDTVGDCTCAAAGHAIQCWTANASRKEVTITDAQVLKAYSAVTGYDPNKPNTDRGAVAIEVLKYWRKQGIARHRIQAFVAPEPKNHAHIRAAVALFGSCYIGLSLPISAQRQQVWSVPPGGPSGEGAAGSWGGHAVVVVGYNDHWLSCITWGAEKRMTWSFWDAYCDEAYAILSTDWVKANQSAPSGFDLEALKADLKQVAR
jgi:hypothetical protein